MIPGSDIFGLSDAMLGPLLETALGRGVEAFSVHFRHRIEGHPGYRGEKRIPTFAYTACDGTRGKISMFVKRLSHPRGGTAPQTQVLAAHGAPVPSLYGILKDGAGVDIVFLEYLPVIYRDDTVFRSADLLGRFISLAACLNAIPLPGLGSVLPHHEDLCGMPELQIASLEITANHAAKGCLGDDLKRFFHHQPSALPAIGSMLGALAPLVADFPSGLIHGDFSPFHTGSRAGSMEMIAIDFGCVSEGPRFFDIAPLLVPPQADRPLCMPCEEIAGLYVKEFNARSGSDLSVKEVLFESNALWVVWNARRIPWLLETAMEGDRRSRSRLHALFSRLVCIQNRLQSG